MISLIKNVIDYTTVTDYGSWQHFLTSWMISLLNITLPWNIW